MAKLIWSNIAIYDLRQIYEYIAKDSIKYAEKVLDNIIKKSEYLTAFPRMGRVVPELNEEQIREIVIYSHRLVYEVVSHDEIRILALVHVKKEFPMQEHVQEG